MSKYVQTVELHRFVYDAHQVKRFAEFISSHNGVHQLFIAARSKYQTDEQKVQHKIKHTKTMTKSFHNVTPERFLSLVKSFEQPISTFDGHDASVLVIYGTTNPRDVKKANQKYLTDIIGTAFVGCDDDDDDDYYPIKRGKAGQAGQAGKRVRSGKTHESENECNSSKPIFLSDIVKTAETLITNAAETTTTHTFPTVTAAPTSPTVTAAPTSPTVTAAPTSPTVTAAPTPLTTTAAPSSPTTTPTSPSRQFTRFLPDNLHSYLMSSKGHVSLLTMDIDDKSALAPVEEFLREIGIPRTLVETRGGYHLFLDVKYSAALFSKPKFREFTKLHSTGDTFCPIPGTYQGGFPVRFVD
jgi:hypothetical protein